MDRQKLDKITEHIIDNVMRSGLVYEVTDDNIIYLMDIIASLHNELYKEVTGDYYDYMFHWTNKCGYNGINDAMYKTEVYDNERIN